MNETFNLEPFSLLAGVLIGLALGAVMLVFQGRSKAALENAFRGLADQALAANAEHFLNVAQERIRQLQGDNAHDLDKRRKEIEQLVEPVRKTLSTMDEKIGLLEKNRIEAYTELKTHLKNMTEDQAKLRTETAALVQALRSPSTRGQWGEMQLRRCLEMAGMQRGVHFDEQVSSLSSSSDNDTSRQRPDVLVRLTGGKTIVIDSKAPIEGYLESLRDGLSAEERAAQLDRHARHVRTHLQNLGSKAYWKQFESPEFVVMFLPAESYFSAALERDPSLIEAGVDLKVLMATPTTLISLLKAVMYGWRQEQLAENARAVAALGSELYDRIGTFAGHLDKVGRGLNTATDSYNKAVASLESRVLVSARKLHDLHVTKENREISAPGQVEQTTRALMSGNGTDSEQENPELSD